MLPGRNATTNISTNPWGSSRCLSYDGNAVKGHESDRIQACPRPSVGALSGIFQPFSYFSGQETGGLRLGWRATEATQSHSVSHPDMIPVSGAGGWSGMLSVTQRHREQPRPTISKPQLETRRSRVREGFFKSWMTFQLNHRRDRYQILASLLDIMVLLRLGELTIKSVKTSQRFLSPSIWEFHGKSLQTAQREFCCQKKMLREHFRKVKCLPCKIPENLVLSSQAASVVLCQGRWDPGISWWWSWSNSEGQECPRISQFRRSCVNGCFRMDPNWIATSSSRPANVVKPKDARLMDAKKGLVAGNWLPPQRWSTQDLWSSEHLFLWSFGLQPLVPSVSTAWSCEFLMRDSHCRVKARGTALSRCWMVHSLAALKEG